MVSMKDIARELNLSRCTVSNILNNKLDQYSYRKETIELVRKKSEEMGYVINSPAQSLKTGSVRMLALVIPDVANTFYIEIIKEVEKLAYEQDYGLIVCFTEEKVDKEKRILEMLKSRRIDGVLIAFVSYEESYIDEKVYKAVAFDRIIKKAKIPMVTINDKEVAYQLTCRIIKEGGKRPLFLGTSPKDYTIQERLKGFKQALQEYQLDFYPENIIYNLFNEIDAYEKIKRVREAQPDQFDSILSTNNDIIYGIMKVMGDDFKKIVYGGFYSYEGASFMGERIINVMPPTNMAGEAFRLLVDRISNKETQSIVLETKIV